MMIFAFYTAPWSNTSTVGTYACAPTTDPVFCISPVSPARDTIFCSIFRLSIVLFDAAQIILEDAKPIFFLCGGAVLLPICCLEACKFTAVCVILRRCEG